MANERGNLLDRRKFHMMKSGSPRGMVGGKNEKEGLERLVGTLRKWPEGSGQLYRLAWSSEVVPG